MLVGRMRALLVGLSAAFAFSAGVASASAEGPTWNVNKAKLVGSKNIKSAVVVTKNFELKKKNNGLTVTCTTLKDNAGKITAPDDNSATSLEFTKCTVTAPKEAKEHCKVKEEKVVTKGVKSEVQAGTPLKVEFAPETGTLFTTITIQSSVGTCLQKGAFEVTGQATGEGTTLGTESKKQPLKFTTTSGSNLEFGGEKAEFTGEAELELESEETWSAS